jgi:hypothetical protein
MNYVWNNEGVRVMSVTMNRWDGMQMWTSGYALNERDEIIGWEASAMSGGWLVSVKRANGFALTVTGSSFNLPLEVAAAIRRM